MKHVRNSLDWQNPKITNMGREKPVSFFIPYNEKDNIDYEVFETSSNYMLLNGDWSFKYFEAPEYVPEGVENADFSVEDFDTIPVPMSWQMVGYGTPNYLNASYPIPTFPPFVPNENPTGVYKKSFDIPENFEGKRVYINFEGVNSFYYLYINGEFVGFSKGAHSLAKFEITDFIKDKKIDVTVIVLKWSDGTYLEDQDCYRHNGIYRDVYLTARSRDFIEDVEISTSLENNYKDGKISVSATSDGVVNEAEISCLDPSGKVIFTGKMQKNADKLFADFKIPSALKWNAETPYLYTLYIKANGEVIPFKFGVRTIETSEKGQLLINGKPVKLYGVNRHDSSPTTGHYVSVEHIIRDLLIMKRHNINCIRCSHYPNSSIFLHLCDRFGFYVIDEGDIEAHGCGVDFMMEPRIIGDNLEWKDAFIDRVYRMAMRDRNHPSVIMWSMGNESEFGECQKAAIDCLAEFGDKDGRLIHYQGQAQDIWARGRVRGKDIFRLDGDFFYDKLTVRSEMYTLTLENMKIILESSDPRPYFLCEFGHAMGVGPGGLDVYMNAIEEYDNFIGGCIWEWCDHSVEQTDENGKPFFTYGGYFGDFPNDENFCCDGLVYPNRKPHTGIKEYKEFIKPLYAKITGENQITLYSRYDFINSDNLTATVCIMRDGKCIKETTYKTNVPPRGSEVLTTDLSVPDDGRDYRVKVLFKTTNDTLWEKAGYEVGFSEEILKEAADKKDYYIFEEKAEQKKAPLKYSKSGVMLTVSGNGFEYSFNTLKGALAKVVKNGKTVINKEVQLCAFRAPHDNDRNIKAEWFKERLDRLYTTCFGYEILNQDENSFVFKANVHLAAATIKPILVGTVTYEVNNSGEISVNISTLTREGLEFTLPRFGMEFSVSEDFENIKYLGNGPFENYPDFKLASSFGEYTSTVTEQYEPYIFPQSCGNHTDVRYVKLTEKGGEEITFVPKGNMHFTAMHFTEDDLHKASYTKDLTPRKDVILHIDYKNGGIGSNSCGPMPELKHTIDRRKIDFTFKLF